MRIFLTCIAFILLSSSSFAHASGNPEKVAKDAALEEFDTPNRPLLYFSRYSETTEPPQEKSSTPPCPGASQLVNFDESMAGEAMCLKDDKGNVQGTITTLYKSNAGECSTVVPFRRTITRQQITRTETDSSGKKTYYCILLGRTYESWNYDCVKGQTRLKEANKQTLTYDNLGNPLSEDSKSDELNYGNFSFPISRTYFAYRATVKMRTQADANCPKITANLATSVTEKKAFAYPSSLYNPKSPYKVSDCVENGGTVSGCFRPLTSHQWQYRFGAELNNDVNVNDNTHYQWATNLSLIVQDYPTQSGAIDLSKRIVIGDTVGNMGSVVVSAINWFHTNTFGLAVIPASMGPNGPSTELYEPNWNNFYMLSNLSAPICGSCSACTNNQCPPPEPE